MSAVKVIVNTGRPGGRMYLAGHRCHHGMTGLVLAASAVAYLNAHEVPWAACAALIAGGVLMWHDRHDFPWLSDRDVLFAHAR